MTPLTFSPKLVKKLAMLLGKTVRCVGIGVSDTEVFRPERSLMSWTTTCGVRGPCDRDNDGSEGEGEIRPCVIEKIKKKRKEEEN